MSFIRRTLVTIAISVLGLGLLTPGTVEAQAAPRAPAARPKAFTTFVRNWTRVEMWRFFEPPPGSGDPTYDYIGNRLLFGIERHTKRYDVQAAGQYVQFGGLPTNASAPAPLGPMGAGALYYAQGGKTPTSRHLWVRYANFRLKDLKPGWSVFFGRMNYTSGAEVPSGDAKIETIKRQRVDSRLLGEFEWTLYQRSWDGVRTDVDRKAYHATAAFLRPTQGGFEDNAGVEITKINVFTGTVAVKPGKRLRHSDWESFVVRYDDTRAVTGRPDNSGQTATGADVHITTVGSMLIGAYPVTPSQQFDVLVWAAFQTGDWYGQAHRAGTITTEAGLQWTKAPWKPWIRGGFTHASGDKDGTDNRHGTYFQVVPTVRRFSLSTTYSIMNLNDGFVQILATPRSNISVRLDVRHLTLASAADRWYYGSGATQKAGTAFGYSGRPSLGHKGLGNITEGSIDYRFNPHWSMNGYVCVFQGGDVVTANFTGSKRALTLGYVENVLQF